MMAWVLPSGSLTRAVPSPRVGELANGSRIPLIMGRIQVPGRIFYVDYVDPNWIVGVLWGMGELDAIEKALLDGADPVTGVVQEHHRGNEAGVVSALIRAVDSSYNDTGEFVRGFTFRWAYSVFKIPKDAYRTFPSFQAVVRGLKVDGGSYDDEPIRMARFLIENAQFGLGEGVEASGFEDASNRNKGVLRGKPRRSVGIYLENPASVENWIQFFADYGGAWIFREGDKWVCVAKKPQTSFEPVDEGFWVKGGFRGALEGLRSSPTRVELRFMDTSGDVWVPRVATHEISPV